MYWLVGDDNIRLSSSIDWLVNIPKLLTNEKKNEFGKYNWNWNLMNMILDWEYKNQCLKFVANGLEIIFVLYENLNKNDFQMILKWISGVWPLDIWKISFGNECTHYRRLFFQKSECGRPSMFLYSLNKIEMEMFLKYEIEFKG